jgi:hypothetical protein
MQWTTEMGGPQLSSANLKSAIRKVGLEDLLQMWQFADLQFVCPIFWQTYVTSGNLQINNFLLKNTALRGLSHWIWLLMLCTVWLVLGLNRGRSHFLNILIAPMLL